MLFPLMRKDQSMNLTAALMHFVVLEVQIEHIVSILPREVPGPKPMGTVTLRNSKFDGKM